MAAYISVPRDFSKVKSKVAFNLTARQLICFGAAAVVGVPLFFVLRDTAGNSGATLGMMAVMLPMFFLAMYQKNGQPAEKILRYYFQARFVRPKVRPYQTRNYYALLMKGDDTHDSVSEKENKGVRHMLAEERFSRILSIIEAEGSATIQELMTALDASESTVRRDLITMDENGLLTKVHGGAIARRPSVSTHDEDVRNRKTMNAEQKNAIAKYAASLIRPDDFVYLDAGTSTEAMIPFIKETQAVFVTNAISHAKLLAEKGCRVYLLGGEFKSQTEAIVGEEAMEMLSKYNFTKGFWGTNGISVSKGYSTPEIKEAMVKKYSMKNCKRCYILADASKFDQLSSVKFADFEQATILTTELYKPALKKYKNIVEVKE